MEEKKSYNEQIAVETVWTREIAEGNKGSFEKLFNNYCQSLINFSRRYVLDRQVAENIVQEIFVRIWTNRSSLDPAKNIKSYLYTSVKNESLKYLRHLDVEQRSAEKLIPSVPHDNRPDMSVDAKELEIKIQKAVYDLPEKCREIFTMNRFENLKYSEIAEILNISVKTVETQMGRALKKLRENLKYFLMIVMTVVSVL
jgi:RNA polymerase sigma-70 factor (ECF subfamily)